MSGMALPSFRRPIFETVPGRARAPPGAAAGEAVACARGGTRAQGDTARRLAARDERRDAILILDEVQKVPGWSDVVKLHWDEDTSRGTNLKVFLPGSAPLLVQRGLSESLAGRVELSRVP